MERYKILNIVIFIPHDWLFHSELMPKKKINIFLFEQYPNEMQK